MALVDAVPFVVANWPLNEASGNALDAVGSNTLTDNNGVGSAAGKLYPLARQFDASSGQWLEIADNPDISMSDIDFMIRCWVKVESLSGTGTSIVAGKWLPPSNGEYVLFLSADGKPALTVSPDGTGTAGNARSVVSSIALELDTWYLIHAWHDATNDLIGIAVDAGTAQTASYSGGVYDGTQVFTLGRVYQTDPQYFDGQLQDVVVMKNRFLTAAERTEDYNGGDGIAFLDWDGDSSSSSSPSSASSESSSSTSSDSSQSSESSSDSSESSSASSESSSASSESSSTSSESSSPSSESSSDSSDSSSASSESSSESSSDSSQSSSSSQSDSSTDSSSSSGLGRPRFGFPLLYWGDWW